MEIKKVCVLGGGGFVGQHVVSRLCEQGYEVRVPYRNINRAKHLTVLPTVSLVEADIHDPVELKKMLQGMDAVVNLVGILHERKRGAFQRAHVDLPRKVVEACRATGVKRLLHMSAIGASVDGLSRYQRSKGEGEALVREAHGEPLAVTVFRPSVIFGPGDSFLNLFAGLLNWTPVFPLGSSSAKMQPIYVGDVAQAIVASVNNPATFGQSYDLCGPTVYTLQELVEYVAEVKGLKRTVIPLSAGMSSLQSIILGLMPIKLLTHDNYLTLKTDAVCACPFPEVFGIQPAAVEAEAPLYLAPIAAPLFKRFIDEKR
ncbi:nucleoside-diphosphate-sugar epimerase [Sulfuricella denitrificans skB26]|uniref:Nucleoside-diphosphate-sugar epimerase n=1 Tax=Sulfuricella denitrificans (strain DSM 22764 / NBRC 105220 / skB26) TaxID=1163617 RepID=S6AEN9_SULDS|nr:complex I NDUFA9 subunit family protein [Sulfuricella denitrificans]BAN34246.1 nucleoside-diphosphate-sugar epimerase [Sulfuricella denitrificans skB26]